MWNHKAQDRMSSNISPAGHDESTVRAGALYDRKLLTGQEYCITQSC